MNNNRPASLAGWSVRHPVGILAITLAVVVLGLAAFERLGTDLLPKLIHPDVLVRVLSPGTPATVMEDEVTRQLEEQLAITEQATHIQSRTREGRSAVDLSFDYGTDIDAALRDASTRLDRAKRFLPDNIQPPIIYKRDPSQRAVVEFVISSARREPAALRDWVDYHFSKWFINLPGVASAETGGGAQREIQVLIDPDRLAALGLDAIDLSQALQQANQDSPAGRMTTSSLELSVKAAGRLDSIEALQSLPLRIGREGKIPAIVALGDISEIVDANAEQRLLIRLNHQPGVKLSIQKQPGANTIAVVDAVNKKLAQLRREQLLPDDIQVNLVADEARHIRISVRNAAMAALSGGLLAMLVVYLFLGNLRRTLIIGSAIPLAILVTFILMSLAGLTLNIMTLGGLALGIGLLVDNTIVMLENIQRHQATEADAQKAAIEAAHEVSSPIIASTTTNLAAVLPFLFIGGLSGLLFQSLILTISCAILASLLVAMTLIPALSARIAQSRQRGLRKMIDRLVNGLSQRYANGLRFLMRHPLWIVIFFVLLFISLVPGYWLQTNEIFLPKMDDGRIYIGINADRGTRLQDTEQAVRQIEQLVSEQPHVASLYTTVGGMVFGRSRFEASNRASISVILHNDTGQPNSADWIKQLRPKIAALQLVGIQVYLHARGIRGIRSSRGNDDVSLMLQGADQTVLQQQAQRLTEALQNIPGLSNIQSSTDDQQLTLNVDIDRVRARDFGLNAADIGQALQIAVAGSQVSKLLLNDRRIPVRLRVQPHRISSSEDLRALILFSKDAEHRPLRLGEIAKIQIESSNAELLRDAQQRVVEISASLSADSDNGRTLQQVQQLLENFKLPAGYRVYDAGRMNELNESHNQGLKMLGMALLLVLVVMEVQYESIRNPLIILFSIPFALIGVVSGLSLSGLPLSMPVWLGLIMLGGIVVNNAIVLVDYIEQLRHRGLPLDDAVFSAARIRLRPILMTTLTTVVGMLPLALALSSGAELLQPLAVTLISGLLFSLLVSLYLIPSVYLLLNQKKRLLQS